MCGIAVVSGSVTVSFDTEANAIYYRLGRGKATRSRKLRRNRLDYVIDFDRKGAIVGVEVLNMKKALALAASESLLLLPPLEQSRPDDPDHQSVPVTVKIL